MVLTLLWTIKTNRWNSLLLVTLFCDLLFTFVKNIQPPSLERMSPSERLSHLIISWKRIPLLIKKKKKQGNNRNKAETLDLPSCLSISQVRYRQEGHRAVTNTDRTCLQSDPLHRTSINHWLSLTLSCTNAATLLRLKHWSTHRTSEKQHLGWTTSCRIHASSVTHIRTIFALIFQNWLH